MSHSKFDGVFGANAEFYLEKGLSVLPTEPVSKRPASDIPKWNGYLNNMPSGAKRLDWVRRYQGHGLALMLGSTLPNGRRVIALDTDVNQYVPVTRVIVGSPFVGKVGARGETLFLACDDGEGIKSCKLTTHMGEGVIDLLAAGKITIMPPTLHPDTGEPYREIGTPLYEALDTLPLLTKVKLERLRYVLSSPHTRALLSGVSTHEPGLRISGGLVNLGVPDDEILAIISALLPEGYGGDSLDELPGWIAKAREKGYERKGPAKGRKPSEVEIIVGVLDDAGVTLNHDAMRRPYLSVPNASGGKLTYRLGSDAGSEAIGGILYKRAKVAIRQNTLRDVLELLKARAKHDSPEIPVHTRIARHDGAVLIDLGRDDGELVRITPGCVELTYDNPALFLRAIGSLPLPRPDLTGGREDLKKLRLLLGLSKKNFVLMLAFLLNCLRPGGPFMCLLVEGQQGSGKSFFSAILRWLIDPNSAEKVRLPEEEQELMVLANNTFLLVFDNSSGMRAQISDLLCAISTGSATAKRRLYTDDDVNIMQAVRPYIINGISDIASRPDLLERAISIELERMPEGQRRTEEELLAEFKELQPRVMGALYNIVAGALTLEHTVPVPRNIRMADTARWLAASEEAAGLPAGAFARFVRASQDARMAERMNNEPIVHALRKMLEKGPFEGTVGQLLDTLRENITVRTKYFPETALKLSKDMERLKTGMVTVGMHFERGERTKEGRTLRVWVDGQEAAPAQVILDPVEY